MMNPRAKLKKKKHGRRVLEKKGTGQLIEESEHVAYKKKKKLRGHLR